ncbi:MAG: hypothetical protein Tsb0034_21010 [Ekhidna sp.]
MAVTVKYFGAIAEETGITQENLDVKEVEDVDALRSYCLSKYGNLKELTFQVAVNQSIKSSGPLSDGDEVALLPPFAGG